MILIEEMRVILLLIFVYKYFPLINIRLLNLYFADAIWHNFTQFFPVFNCSKKHKIQNEFRNEKHRKTNVNVQVWIDHYVFFWPFLLSHFAINRKRCLTMETKMKTLWAMLTFILKRYEGKKCHILTMNSAIFFSLFANLNFFLIAERWEGHKPF